MIRSVIAAIKNNYKPAKRGRVNWYDTGSWELLVFIIYHSAKNLVGEIGSCELIFLQCIMSSYD
jgi:hypothetical protein